MTRYLSSFIITSILYSIVIGVFFYAYSNQKIGLKKEVEKKQVSLKHIVLIKKVEPELPIIEKKIVEPTPKIVKPVEKIVKEEKPKKIVKKKKKRKKIVKKKLEKIKEPKKEEPKIVQEVIIEEPIVPLEKIVKNSAPVKVSSTEYKKDFLRKNLLLIKKHIQSNVKYSKRARKMNIQGDVLVEFCLSKNGTITSIKALSGHRLLRKSTIKAIYKASSFFPKVSRNIIIKIPIEYKLI